MTTVSIVQRQIERIEGFNVRFLHPITGSDVHDAKQHVPSYPYQRAAKNAWTVAHWKRDRFHNTYAGYTVAVLDAKGRDCHGRTLLSNVRDEYLPD